MAQVSKAYIAKFGFLGKRVDLRCPKMTPWKTKTHRIANWWSTIDYSFILYTYESRLLAFPENSTNQAVDIQFRCIMIFNSHQFWYDDFFLPKDLRYPCHAKKTTKLSLFSLFLVADVGTIMIQDSSKKVRCIPRMCMFTRNQSSICIHIYIYTWNPNDPCFGWKRALFWGVDLQK